MQSIINNKNYKYIKTYIEDIIEDDIFSDEEIENLISMYNLLTPANADDTLEKFNQFYNDYQTIRVKELDRLEHEYTLEFLKYTVVFCTVITILIKIII